MNMNESVTAFPKHYAEHAPCSNETIQFGASSVKERARDMNLHTVYWALRGVSYGISILFPLNCVFGYPAGNKRLVWNNWTPILATVCFIFPRLRVCSSTPELKCDYEGVSKSFRTGRLERELQIVQLSATRCSWIAVLWVSLVSSAAITLCVASQRVFIVVSIYFYIDSVRKVLNIPSYIVHFLQQAR
jgi:hypothetical protein